MSSVQIFDSDFTDWMSRPIDAFEHAADVRIPVTVVETGDDVHKQIAEEMLAELRSDIAAGKPTRWILPCGPMGQYVYFTDAVNMERLSLANLHVIHMDEFLDWTGRLIPEIHPMSMKADMIRYFYNAVDEPLRVPESQRHFPDPENLGKTETVIDALGGIDTAYGGIGYRGHVAFNEPPRQPFERVSIETFLGAGTRVLALGDDTIISQSQRSAGGAYSAIPTMAITIGFADIMRADRIRLFSVTGSWKQAIVRIAAFSPPTTEFPVTLLQGHGDISLLVDQSSAKSPIESLYE